MSTARAWTEDEDETLRRMANEGCSASQIGVAIGRSRNSIIGRSHRMGIKLGAGATAKPKKPRKPKVRWVDGAIVRPKPTQPVTNKFLEVFKAPPAANEEPQGGGVEFMALGPNHCRWMIGDKYCGCQVIAYRKPYCAHHAYIAKGAPSAARPRVKASWR